jgi:hypothetical protein
MLHKLTLASFLSAALVAPVWADTVFVNETFDDYADDTAFTNQWVPTIGNGTAPANAGDFTSAILTTDTTTFPGLVGKAADHIGASASSPGMVNQYGGVINQGAGQNPVLNGGNNIVPTATQSVFLSYDIYDGASGNERMTVGLRHIDFSGATAVTNNLVELGFYNSNSADPTDPGAWTVTAGNATSETPGFYSGRGYGARLALYGPIAQPLNHGPDWQYFRTSSETWGGQQVGDLGFASELDRDTDTDEVVTIADVGAGWHTFTATITPDTVTFTIDLFRDGLRNTSRTPDENGNRPGEPGVDAKMVLPITTLPMGFNSLRIGGPSGLSSAGPGAQAFDNIILKLIDVGTSSPGDFDGNGVVDGLDFLAWQRDTSIGSLSEWQANYGSGNLTAAATAVPEPASLILFACASLAFAGRRR